MDKLKMTVGNEKVELQAEFELIADDANDLEFVLLGYIHLNDFEKNKQAKAKDIKKTIDCYKNIYPRTICRRKIKSFEINDISLCRLTIHRKNGEIIIWH